MTSPSDDLSGNAAAPPAFSRTANAMLQDSSSLANDVLSDQLTRRTFRTVALGAALVTLVALLVATGAIIWTFLSEFRALALDTQVQLAAAPHLAAASSAAVSTVPALANAPHVWVSLGSFTSSIAALVTALVVAATVLAIALVRASFTLAARGDDPARADADAVDDAPVTLPAADFVKAFGESLQTALKGLQGPARG
jgi:hypothetical protein